MQYILELPNSLFTLCFTLLTQADLKKRTSTFVLFSLLTSVQPTISQIFSPSLISNLKYLSIKFHFLHFFFLSFSSANSNRFHFSSFFLLLRPHYTYSKKNALLLKRSCFFTWFILDQNNNEFLLMKSSFFLLLQKSGQILFLNNFHVINMKRRKLFLDEEDS